MTLPCRQPCINPRKENELYLKEQIITYLGNKRSLLEFIGKGLQSVKRRLKKRKLSTLDVFSGSGIVARYLKKHSSLVISNDIEAYSGLINRCYLSNTCDLDLLYLKEVHASLVETLQGELKQGFFTDLYAPKNEDNIELGERVFYTPRNARFLDTARPLIGQLPEEIQPYFLAPLMAEASVHSNTAGIFKGFYKNREGIGAYGGSGKNALSRIKGNIELPFPVFSRFTTEYQVFSEDANHLMGVIPEVDFAYMDPPYNQHPYGSNYFMLNLLAEYKRPNEVSLVSGIPVDWKRSAYNKRQLASEALFSLVENCPAKFILISYNSEGFIRFEEFMATLKRIGRVRSLETDYNAFRGSRNLANRSIKVKEFLFLVEKH